MQGRGRPWKAVEGHGRPWKVIREIGCTHRPIGHAEGVSGVNTREACGHLLCHGHALDLVLQAKLLHGLVNGLNERLPRRKTQMRTQCVDLLRQAALEANGRGRDGLPS